MPSSPLRLLCLTRPEAMLLIAGALFGCRSTERTAGGRHAADSPVMKPPPAEIQTVKDPGAPAPADSAPAGRDRGTTEASEVSMPNVSYEGLPGWLVIGGPFRLPAPGGDAASTDSALIVFPFDSAWLRPHAPTSLTLLQTAGLTKISLPGRGAAEPYSQGMYLVVHGAPSMRDDLSAQGWLLPNDSATGAAAFPVRDSMSADGNLRTWTAGPARLVLRRVDRTSAQLTGALPGMKPVELRSIAVNAEMDAHMGIDSTTFLSLREDWRIPTILAAYRLRATGPIIVIFEEGGYECSNYRIIVFDRSAIEVKEEPHYSYCGYNR